ncbi:reverse transcriptase-like protein [Heyndrickxia oleronia]|jgi:ribonuclease HI|uniref:RNase H type-1 domain-containing protein n=1 Tax=Heyndrickxia oleronia TaxID=38875 RepID=A0A8E2LDE0_9BACI|nr:reverse transcriptase-like protein [Heyndrickxia oleronia]NYV65366.1 reverse transcriptase-like protein [Bacillus sp. Gen3]MBU5210016.1 reverse transcriptase-like protein [Heyndrickxia oleronia]MCI1592912.1 reverse transcriptase-like protein [Heyndrickxia oleronia]MCI1615274.1 reverse transcriptase-like protein [Heyndrickxia oleronia]MCI1763356.1 reverse transcriptase-like protein [Heyndrickxia oleronia]
MNYKILWKYKAPKMDTILLETEWISEKVIDRLMDDFIKTGRTVDITILDEMGNEWTKKEYVKLKKAIELEPSNIIVYFDGGYDLKQKVAGIGIVIYYDKGDKHFRVRSNYRLEELESNNEAEYAALYNAIMLLEELNIRHMPCTIKGDSHGVLKQLSGEWPCFEKVLNQWLDRIESKIKKLGIKPIYEPIPRSDNKEADQLASQALNNKIVHSQIEL